MVRWCNFWYPPLVRPGGSVEQLEYVQADQVRTFGPEEPDGESGVFREDRFSYGRPDRYTKYYQKYIRFSTPILLPWFTVPKFLSRSVFTGIYRRVLRWMYFNLGKSWSPIMSYSNSIELSSRYSLLTSSTGQSQSFGSHLVYWCNFSNFTGRTIFTDDFRIFPRTSLGILVLILSFPRDFEIGLQGHYTYWYNHLKVGSLCRNITRKRK